MDVGGEIRVLRRKLKLTQQEFADRLGVAKCTVGRWETDLVKPSPLAITRIGDIQREKIWLTILDERQNQDVRKKPLN